MNLGGVSLGDNSQHVSIPGISVGFWEPICLVDIIRMPNAW